MIGQSKKHSLMESLLNIAIGYGIAITAQVIVFPWFGINIPLHSNLAIGGIFTVVSLVRSYCLRRCFNWWHLRQARKAPAGWCPHGHTDWDKCPDCYH